MNLRLQSGFLIDTIISSIIMMKTEGMIAAKNGNTCSRTKHLITYLSK